MSNRTGQARFAFAGDGALDRLGGFTSIACAIHCALAPIILPLLPLAAGAWFEDGLETVFFIATLAIGTTSLAYSYRAVHGDWRAAILFASGCGMLVAVRVAQAEGVAEVAGVAAGAGMVAAAHLLNIRLSRSNRRAAIDAAVCPCSCHDEQR